MKEIFIKLPLAEAGNGLRYVGEIDLIDNEAAVFAVEGRGNATDFINSFEIDLRDLALTDRDREALVACDDARCITTNGTNRLFYADGEEVGFGQILEGDGSNSPRSAMIAIPRRLIYSPLELALGEV